MSHRIDIELTSAAESGWTWRAAGARQPKGVIDTTMLYPGAKVGDVVRAEAERELDGTRILSIVAPKSKRTEAERIEIAARPVTGPSVQVTYADKPRGRDGGREGGRDGERRGPRPDRADRGPRSDRGGERPDRGDRPARPTRSDRPASERPERGPRPDRPDRPVRAERSAPDRGRPKRFTPSRVHRDSLIDALPPEHRPVADQLFRGGIPAVRQAIIDQNAQLKAAGQPEIPPGPLLALADELLPRTRQADWLDRAAAALQSAGDISLRDLRAVVTQADGVARDDDSRAMAAKLREALQGRVEGERTSWIDDIASSASDGKLIRAIRLAGRLPDPAAKLPAELVARLVSETNAALTPDVAQDRWAALIEAAAEAPFRREIVPVGLPTTTNEGFLAAAAQASNRIPSLLKLLGLSIPPPPRAKALPPRPPSVPPRPATPAAVTPAAVTPAAVTPAAVTPTGVTPTGVTPTAVTPTAVTPTAAASPVVVVESVVVESVVVESVVVEPVVVEPVAIEPVAIEPVAVEPTVVVVEPGVVAATAVAPLPDASVVDAGPTAVAFDTATVAPESEPAGDSA